MTQQRFPRGRPPAPTPRRDLPSTPRVYPLPADTRAALEKFRADNRQCRNLGLMFDRYIGYLPGWRLDDKRTSPKHDALQLICETPVESELLKESVKRWRAMVGNAKILTGNPRWRFLTGLGRKGPLEIGFTFHRLYGVPIIPGSSLKGLTRSWALLCPDQAPEIGGSTPEERADDPLFKQVFGSTQGQGAAIFYDAIPEMPPVLELDVMNPHYPDYYQGDEPPANWQSPQPVFFLTLGAKSRFLFAVGGKQCELAAQWLERALGEMGVGAKTSAGYGYWDVKRI